jgi:hypothetical protein
MNIIKIALEPSFFKAGKFDDRRSKINAGGSK